MSHSHATPHTPRVDRGIVLAIFAAVAFGASTPFSKQLLHSLDPALTAGLLYLGSGVGLAALLLVRRVRNVTGEPGLARADVPWMTGAVVFGGLFAPLALMTGLRATPASSAALLLNLEAVFTALLAWVVFRENVGRRVAIGMVAIVAAGALLSWSGPLTLHGARGPLLIAAACLCWAIDNNLTQKIAARDAVQIASIKGLCAGVVNTALGLTVMTHAPRANTVAAALALGFVSYGLSLVGFVRALQRLGTARTGAYFALAPFVGAVGAMIGLGERPTPVFAGAAMLMAVGVWLHLTEHHEHDHTHEPLVHTHRHEHDAHHRHAHPPGVDPHAPHSHEHAHERLVHRHPHYPDDHHRHHSR